MPLIEEIYGNLFKVNIVQMANILTSQQHHPIKEKKKDKKKTKEKRNWFRMLCIFFNI